MALQRTHLIANQVPAIKRAAQLVRKQMKKIGVLPINLSELHDSIAIGLGYGSYKDLLATAEKSTYHSPVEHENIYSNEYNTRRSQLLETITPLIKVNPTNWDTDVDSQDEQSNIDEYMSDQLDYAIGSLKLAIETANWCPPTTGEDISVLEKELNRIISSMGEPLAEYLIADVEWNFKNRSIVFATNISANSFLDAFSVHAGYSPFLNTLLQKGEFLLSHTGEYDDEHMYFKLEFNEKFYNRNTLPQWMPVWALDYETGHTVVIVEREGDGYRGCTSIGFLEHHPTKELLLDRKTSLIMRKKFEDLLATFGYTVTTMNRATSNSMSTDKKWCISA